MENTQKKIDELLRVMENWGMFDNISKGEKQIIIADINNLVYQSKVDMIETMKKNLFK
jgi:hypothetical protein